MKKVITCLLACIFMLFGATGAYAVETDLSEVEPEDKNLVEVIDQNTKVISTDNVETTESKAEEEKQKNAVTLCAAIMLGTIIAVLAIAIILKTKLR